MDLAKNETNINIHTTHCTQSYGLHVYMHIQMHIVHTFM